MKYPALSALLLASLCHAAIALDATANSGSQTGSSASWSHTSSGSNRVLWVGIGVRAWTGSTIAVTYNGVSMTGLTGQGVGTQGDWVQWFYLIAPATGTNTVNASGIPTSSSGWAGFSISYTGADQTTQPDAGPSGGTSSNASLTSSVTVATANAWVAAVSMSDGGAITVGAGYTSRGAVTPGYGFAVEDSNGGLGTGSQAAGWTVPGGGFVSATSAIAIRPASSSSNYSASTTEQFLSSLISAPVAGHFSTQFEAVSVMDTPLGSAGRPRVTSEGLISQSSTQGFSAHVAAPQEALTLLIGSVGQGVHFIIVADAVMIRDLAAGSTGHYQSATDSLLALRDTGSGFSGHVGSALESIAVADSPVGLGAHFASGRESFRILDSASKTNTAFRLVSEMIRTIDSSLALASHFASWTDSTRLTDSNLGFGAHNAKFVETSTIRNTTSMFGAHFGQASEDFAFTDISIRGGGSAPQHFTAGITELVGLYDRVFAAPGPMVSPNHIGTYLARPPGVYILKTEHGIYIMKTTTVIVQP